MYGFGVVEILITFVVLLAIFIVCREINCWYWKINERIELLKDIKNILQQQNESNNHEEIPQLKAEIDIDERWKG